MWEKGKRWWLKDEHNFPDLTAIQQVFHQWHVTLPSNLRLSVQTFPLFGCHWCPSWLFHVIPEKRQCACPICPPTHGVKTTYIHPCTSSLNLHQSRVCVYAWLGEHERICKVCLSICNTHLFVQSPPHSYHLLISLFVFSVLPFIQQSPAAFIHSITKSLCTCHTVVVGTDWH